MDEFYYYFVGISSSEGTNSLDSERLTTTISSSAMPKRTVAYSPSPNSKKVKVEKGQSSLDNFFSSSGSNNGMAGVLKEGKGKGKVEPQDQTGIFDDRKIAEALAKKDGLDMATVLRLEAEWKVSTQQQGVIDVDSPNEENPYPTAPRAEGSARPSHLLSSPNAGSSTMDSSNDLPKSISSRLAPGSSATTPVYQPLSVDPLSFVPDNEPFLCNTPTPYSFLSHTLATLSGTRSPYPHHQYAHERYPDDFTVSSTLSTSSRLSSFKLTVTALFVI